MLVRGEPLPGPDGDLDEANAKAGLVEGLSRPGRDPQEGVWSLVKHDIGNLAAADLSQITRAVKRKLKMLQYRPEVINGCLAGTGLVLEG